MDDVLGRTNSPIFINPGRNPNGILFAEWKSFILNHLEGISQSDFDKFNETEHIIVDDLIRKINSIN
ncbi:hypothetical protein [Allomuricauda sp. M10]|uniref:hypothetical protein n=1 Tax=Allomuricauda sp. M10 TaxID=2683292 RepID=UPI001D189F2F|nr:hypothetical protein [Muricauda sp. M10]